MKNERLTIDEVMKQFLTSFYRSVFSRAICDGASMQVSTKGKVVGNVFNKHAEYAISVGNVTLPPMRFSKLFTVAENLKKIYEMTTGFNNLVTSKRAHCVFGRIAGSTLENRQDIFTDWFNVLLVKMQSDPAFVDSFSQEFAQVYLN